jgi:hypothetical protein
LAVAESGPDGWLSLKGGIEIQFTGKLFRTGDYWLIPARTLTGDIDWPFTGPQPPLGIKHHHARIAVLQRTPNDDSLSIQDWRRRFSPLAEAAPALRIIGINWLNDDTVTLPQLKTDGLQIVLDGAPAPIVTSIGSNVMVVKMEVPVLLAADTTTPRPHAEVILNGTVSLAANGALQWLPRDDGAELAPLLAAYGGQSSATDKSPRMHVTLKGNAIWSDQGGTRLYLDGQALGQPGLRNDQKTPRRDLAFPCGVDARASDFHSWFYLFAEIPQPGLASTAGIREGAPGFGRHAHRGYGSLRATAPSAGSVGRV